MGRLSRREEDVSFTNEIYLLGEKLEIMSSSNRLLTKMKWMAITRNFIRCLVQITETKMSENKLKTSSMRDQRTNYPQECGSL